MAAGPLTLDEAVEALSNRHPPMPAPHSERQSQSAPAPDYGSDLGAEGPSDVEPCSCDEALALREQVARLTLALAAAERDSQDYEQRWLKAERDCGAAQRETAQLLEALHGH